MFRPVHDQTGGTGGYVSVEVSPLYGRNVDPTPDMARELWVRRDRPNIRVKIPAAAEGIPSIHEARREGAAPAPGPGGGPVPRSRTRAAGR